MLATCVASAGVGIGYAAMPTLILQHVPAVEAASSVGVNALMRSMGTTVAGAVMALVLTSQVSHPVLGLALPTAGAFRLCFFIGAAAAVAGSVVAFLIPVTRGSEARSTSASAPANDLEPSLGGL